MIKPCCVICGGFGEHEHEAKAYCAKCIRELPCAVCGSPVGEQGVQVGGLWVCGKCANTVYEQTPQQCPSCGHYEPFHDVDCEAEIARVLEKLRKQEAA